MKDVAGSRTLDTRESVELFVSLTLDRMRELFERDGVLEPVAMLIARCNPQTKVKYPSPQLKILDIREYMTDPDTKDRLSDAMERLARDAKADLMLIASEAWMVAGEKGVGMKEAELLAMKGELEHHSARKEVVMVSVCYKEWPEKQRLYSAEIDRSKEKPVLLPFTCFDGFEHEGRLSNLL